VFQKLAQFRRTETGSVTTDWVVLAVATVLFSVIVISSVFGGAFLELIRLSGQRHPAEQAHAEIGDDIVDLNVRCQHFVK